MVDAIKKKELSGTRELVEDDLEEMLEAKRGAGVYDEEEIGNAGIEADVAFAPVPKDEAVEDGNLVGSSQIHLNILADTRII